LKKLDGEIVLSKKRYGKEPSIVLANILNLLRFHPFIDKLLMFLDNLKNHAG